MALKDLIKKARSYRRFDESVKVGMDTLEDIVSCLRYISSAKNLQPLKYVLCSNREVGLRIFSTLQWAGYLSDWKGPAEGERPVAYIVILKDRNISNENYVCYDAGIAIQTIMLLLVERGLGGCTIAAIDRERLSEILELEKHLEILCVVAIGKPSENVVVVDAKDGEIRYYRDEKGTHYVPKRPVGELIYKKIPE